MDNQFNYTILPCGLKQTSVKEIVDAYNNLNNDSRQYEDLIFVKNLTIIDNQFFSFRRKEFGVIKTLTNNQIIIQNFGLPSFRVPPGTQSYNNGLSLFTGLQSSNDDTFYIDFAIFTFK
jgi:hypothetical protein